MIQQYEYERFTAWEAFQPLNDKILKSKADILKEIQHPCSRFKNPLSWDEKIRAQVWNILGRSSGEESMLALRSKTPANWKNLLNYLREQGIIDTSDFIFNYGGVRSDTPKIPAVRLAAKKDGSDTDGRNVSRYGFGSANTLEESMSKSVGEILERYFMASYRRNTLREISYADLVAEGKKVLDISSLNDFLFWQKKTSPRLVRSDTKPLAWVEGKEFLSGKPIYLPAQLVFWSYRFQRRDEPVLAQSTTSGSAGHFTRIEAIRSALFEAIQRDGFLIYWLNSLSPKKIDPLTFADKDQELKDFLTYLKRYEFEYHFLNITTDVGVPSCACVLVDRNAGEPVITVGAATGFSRKELLIQSAGEALAVNTYVIAKQPYVLKEGYEPFSDAAIGREQRLCAWRGKKMYERFKFFISGESQTFESFIGDNLWITKPEAQLECALAHLNSLGKGYEMYTYEPKHKVLDTLGYHVARVVVPRFMHLYLNENMATLDAPRLRSVPEKLGYTPAKVLNPWPHPFP